MIYYNFSQTTFKQREATRRFMVTACCKSTAVVVCLQVQGICDHRGNIIWYSGPHLGVTSDIKLFRQNSPPLERGERLLADKAYVGERGRLIAPYKKKRGEAQLTQRKRDFNNVHAWYRSTIEHCFAYVKRLVQSIRISSHVSHIVD